MARRNYSKFSKKSEDTNVVEESNEKMNEVFNEVMEEIVEEKPVEKEKTVGVVTGCAKLNVRKKAEKDAEILCIIDKGAEVVIDSFSKGFYKVCTSSGVEGYCMKEFIRVK